MCTICRCMCMRVGVSICMHLRAHVHVPLHVPSCACLYAHVGVRMCARMMVRILVLLGRYEQAHAAVRARRCACVVLLRAGGTCACALSIDQRALRSAHRASSIGMRMHVRKRAHAYVMCMSQAHACARSCRSPHTLEPLMRAACVRTCTSICISA